MNRKHVVPGLLSLVICCLIALQSGTAIGSTCPDGVACPSGAIFNANADQCQADFSACLPGYVYDPGSNKCEVSAPATTSSLKCPSGSTFTPSFGGKCETANLTPCPSGYTYNASTNKCEIPATFTPASSCPDGYTFDSALNKCVGGFNSACPQGTWGNYEQACCSPDPLPGFGWDDETMQYCGSWLCPAGYTNTNGVCSGPMATASCPAGTTINTYTSKCEMAAGPVCAAGQTYNTYNSKCDFAPVFSADPSTCPPGYILNVDTNVCAGVLNSVCPNGGSYGSYENACCSPDPLPGFGWDDETMQYCGGWSCPAGFVRSGSSCNGPACQSGLVYNTATSACEAPATVTASTLVCPSGSIFTPSFGGKCETANLTPCPGGYTYNASTNKCEIPATFTPASSCPDGYTFDSALNKCVGGSNSACPQGTWGNYEQACCSPDPLPGFGWDDETMQYCGSWACPAGYTNTNGVCSGPMATASCPAGTAINTYTSKCEMAAGPVCAAGQTYNTYNSKCDFAPTVSPDAPTCPQGYILNVDTNVCAGVLNSACPNGGSYGSYENACCSPDPLPGFGWDDETMQYCGGWSCPAGFVMTNGTCNGTPCQSGYAYNAGTASCQLSGCPAGTVKIDTLCTAAPVCLQ